MEVLVSVIVPIYKVEPWLRKCVVSIMQQTYRNLEIILVDDGSPDGCGHMCEEFAADDDRIRVIHQRNAGLSAARNRGLEISKGSYILFVDGDDYIEPGTVALLLQACLDDHADAVCCGHYHEYGNRVTTHRLTLEKTCYEGEAVRIAAMKGTVFGHYAWNKLWKRRLFEADSLFPPGRLFEDVATTWRLFLKCSRVVCVPVVLFHYVARKTSIGNTKSMKNLVDRWIAFRDRYDAMAKESEELRLICTKSCLDTIGYTWRWLYIAEKGEKKLNREHEEALQEMKAFLRKNRGDIAHCSFAVRVSLFCALHSNLVTIFGCYCLNQAYRKLRGMDQMV